MFNALLVVVLVMQIVPSFFIGNLEGDLPWLTHNIINLCVVVVQAACICIYLQRKGRFTKVLAFAILVASLWSLFDYMAIWSKLM